MRLLLLFCFPQCQPMEKLPKSDKGEIGKSVGPIPFSSVAFIF